MRILVVACVLLGGCRWILGIDGSKPSQDAAIDATIDPFQDAPGSGIDAAPGAKCYGPVGVWNVCLGSVPTTPVMLTGSLNTDHDARCLGAQPIGWYPAQPSSCFIVGASISIPPANTLRVVGSKPLVLVADTTITIDGTLDVASHANDNGAGANSSACASGSPPTGGPHSGGGGGAGGSFMTAGGDGGDGDIGHGRGGTAPSASSLPTMLRGGCPGQHGFGALSNPRPGGGGALYVVAGSMISVSGSIDASGAGGHANPLQAGGDGGGSGGMVVLFAPALTAVTVFANGGGAAGGSGTNAARQGTDGMDPVVPGSSANGGNGSAPGGRGYAVNHDANRGGSAGTSDGGGGGGGGAGLIIANLPVTGGGVSPPTVAGP